MKEVIKKIKEKMEFLKKYSWAFKILISIAILMFIFQKVNLLGLVNNIFNFNKLVFVSILILFFFCTLIMSLKWFCLFRKYENISFSQLFKLYWASDFIGLFFLGSVGSETYKVCSCKNKKIAFIVSITDRILSFWIFLLISGSIFLILNYSNLFLFIVLIFLIYLFYIVCWNPLINFLSNNKYLKFLQYSKNSYKNLLMHNTLAVLFILLFSLAYFLGIYGFDYNINYLKTIPYIFLLIIFITLPISFQGIGVREFFFVQIGNLNNIPLEISLSASLIIYLSTLIIQILGIIPFLILKKKK